MRVNIIGMAPGWKDGAKQPGEIWGVNDLVFKSDILGLTRSFDVHRELKREPERQVKRRAHAASQGVEHINCDNYPLNEIMEQYGTDYFCSSIDYMIALALYDGATEIHLYGVDMALSAEYAHQKPSAEYWIGYAKGLGVKIAVHGKYSKLMRIDSGITYGFLLPQTLF